MKPKLCMVINVDWFFLTHRLPIALAAAKQGYEVHIACGITDREQELRAYGFHLHPLIMARGRTSPRHEIKTFIEIVQLFKKLKPDVVHLVTIKPVLFGGIAARLAGVNGVVAAISGLGFTYVAKGWKASLKRKLAGCLYRLALGKENLRVIFQNPNDHDILTKITGLPAQKAILLHGSGVDLGMFIPQPLPAGTPRVVMACRLIADKGVWEFIAAARLLRERNVAVEMCLAGAIDPDNPVSLTEADLTKIKSEGVVTLLGNRSDMAQVFTQAHIAALPSYYGEGLPKVLIEAAACGRAVVTTDMPGCRDAIAPGVTGLLIPPRDAKALADAIEQLVRHPEQCAAFGVAGRIFAEQRFDVRQVVEKHLEAYAALLNAAAMRSA